MEQKKKSKYLFFLNKFLSNVNDQSAGNLKTYAGVAWVPTRLNITENVSSMQAIINDKFQIFTRASALVRQWPATPLVVILNYFFPYFYAWLLRLHIFK